MAKIIGNTTATPTPVSDWNQNDAMKADYIKNKPEDVSAFNNDAGYVDETTLTTELSVKMDKVTDGKSGNFIKLDANGNAVDSGSNANSFVPIASLTGLIIPHINNNDIHVTADEKAAWNAKSNFSGAYADLTGKPTKVSAFDNDKGYLTSIPSEYVTETELSAKKYLTSVPAEYITETELEAKKYLTSYTETDPTVPAWAKASKKPTYTASEVGADDSGTASTKVSEHNSSTSAHADIREQLNQLSSEKVDKSELAELVLEIFTDVSEVAL